MAGDSITITTKAYYQSSSATTSVNTAQAIVTSFLSTMSGVSLAEGIHEATGSNSPLSVFDGSMYSTIKNLDPNQNQSTQPKAYLNFAMFDDQFNMVSENSGVRQVQGSTGQLINLVVNKMAIKKTGWLYVYSSNESAVDVFFDNLIITHNAGPLLEEHSYYPFGLEMAGISSKALRASYSPTQYLFNGKKFERDEFNDGWSLNLYDFGARLYDPQIGRFHALDALGGNLAGISPYNYALNNPIRYVDPDGMSPRAATGPGDGDQTGFLTNATESYRRQYPFRAALKELGYLTATVLGLNAIDDYVARRADPKNNTPGQLIVETASLSLAVGVGKGGKGGAKGGGKVAVPKIEALDVVELKIDASRWEESGLHGKEAMEDGVLGSGVVDRPGTKGRRNENLKGVPTEKGKDRDEFPPAVIKPDGRVSVKLISSGDNRGAGASIGNQLKNVPDNTRVVIKVVNLPTIKE